MQVLCPNCHAPVESGPAIPGGELVCTACGSNIRPDRGSTAGWQDADGPRRLGKFELLDVVGSGGFGTVYKARDTELGRVVAVKVPHAGRLAAAGESDRFLREARSVASLRHASIVSVHEVGWQDGVPYLVEDLVDGITMADLLTDDPPSPAGAAELVARVADALEYSHARGVVHRDVKPSNVMLERQPGGGYNPRLMDFGLAKRDGADVTVTLEGQVIGTPAYMSPEQARGEGHRVDGRTDVYSLGVILYQLLTGQLPFRGNARMLLHHLLHDEPRPPRKLAPVVPRDLETVCLKAMAKEPGRRYQSAGEFAADLRRFLAGEPIRARRVGAGERLVLWARRRPSQAALAALVVLVAVGGAGLGAWLWEQKAERKRADEQARQEREDRERADEEARLDRERREALAKQLRVQFYLNTVKRRGVLEGVGPITEEQARHAGRSYKFSTRGGKVERVEFLQGGENPIDNAGEGTAFTGYIADPRVSPERRREYRYEYRYDDQGRVAEELAFDQRGKVLWVFHYTAHGERSTGHYTDHRGFPRARTGSGASYVEFVWTQEGWEGELRYLDQVGRPLPLPDGTHGARKEFDARGLPTRMTYVGADGRPVYHRTLGYAAVAATYDDRGCRKSNRYLDPAGKPVRHADGWDHELRIEYDAYGNQTRWDLSGPDGKPTLQSVGAASWTNKYDDRGNFVGTVYFGTDERPTTTSEGYASWAAKYDERGNQTEWAAFDLDGKPTLNQHGGARWVKSYNAFGQATEVASYGPDERPCLDKYRLARGRFTFDVDGNMVEWAGFGIDGKPARNEEGYALARSRFDDQGNMVERAVYGPDGTPTLHKEGYHKVTRTHDDRGNVLEMQFFGTDGKPILRRGGYAKLTRSYDDRGLRIAESLFGVADEPVVDGEEAYRKMVTVYNDRGLEIERTFIGIDGVLALTSDGIAIERMTHDDRGRLVEEAYFDTSGRPVPHKTSGAARIALSYDDWGRVVEIAFRDADGRATLHKEGIHRLVRRYDERGREVEVEYLGLNGRPVLHRKDGFAREVVSRDALGHVTAESSCGIDGKPVLNKDGYARATYSLDQRGNILEARFYGPDGKPVLRKGGYAGFTAKYDARGNRIEETNLGHDGKDVKPSEAKVTFAYDDRDNTVVESTLGRDGKPVSSTRSVYDARGNKVEESNHDASGELIRDDNRVARTVTTYDARDRAREVRVFNPDGKPGRHREGWSRKTTEYDDRGRKTAEAYFDADGAPVDTLVRWSKVTRSYDDRGNEMVTAYFDAAGRPVDLTQRFARLVRKYNQRDQEVEAAWEDAAGKPVVPLGGFCARITRTFNSRGSITAEAFFGADGKPTLSPAGSAAVALKYDDVNNLVEVAHAWTDGKPVRIPVGWSRMVVSYDGDGNRTNQRYFGPDGEAIPVRLVIVRVDGGSAAEKLGLKVGDVLQTFDGKPLTSLAQHGVMRRDQKGTVEMTVLRGIEKKLVLVAPGLLGIVINEQLVREP